MMLRVMKLPADQIFLLFHTCLWVCWLYSFMLAPKLLPATPSYVTEYRSGLKSPQPRLLPRTHSFRWWLDIFLGSYSFQNILLNAWHCFIPGFWVLFLPFVLYLLPALLLCFLLQSWDLPMHLFGRLFGRSPFTTWAGLSKPVRHY